MEDKNKKKIIVIGNNNMKEEISKKAIEILHDHENVVFINKENTDELTYLFPKDDLTYLYKNPISPEVMAHIEDIQYMELTNKEKNAEILPIRNSKKDPKIGRNMSCPCGSGKKYKNCCGK